VVRSEEQPVQKPTGAGPNDRAGDGSQYQPLYHRGQHYCEFNEIETAHRKGVDEMERGRSRTYGMVLAVGKVNS
jgi:hypothetical protein